MTELYTNDYAQKMRKRYKTWLFICAITAIVTLLICICLCANVTTANARKMYIAAVCISTLAGWVYLLYLRPKRRMSRAEYIHCENVLKSDEISELSGILSVSKTRTRIPGSIIVKTVKLTGSEGVSISYLNSNFTLPLDGTSVTLRTAGRYVCAYEVNENA